MSTECVLQNVSTAGAAAPAKWVRGFFSNLGLIAQLRSVVDLSTEVRTSGHVWCVELADCFLCDVPLGQSTWRCAENIFWWKNAILVKMFRPVLSCPFPLDMIGQDIWAEVLHVGLSSVSTPYPVAKGIFWRLRQDALSCPALSSHAGKDGHISSSFGVWFI